MTKNSIKSKPSTESDISTKNKGKSRERSEIDRLLDLYWSGSERRITGLTLKILAVNVVALVLLAIGVLYLGQYHNNVIEARMQTFEREMELVSVVLSESNFQNESGEYSRERVEPIVQSLGLSRDKQVYVFDASGDLIIHTENAPGDEHQGDRGFQSFEVLKDLLKLILFLLPDRKDFPVYSYPTSWHAKDYPGVESSLSGHLELQVWEGRESPLFLTASVPLMKGDEIWGALLLTWEGYAIEEDMNEVWETLLFVFFGTFILTIFLSIYLSGVIAQPLKKLAKAAENVRKGQGQAEDIPDFSDRLDEIGELSLVLRDMTMTLSEKMDLIERFAADVSHELKNPLTSLRSAVETLSVVKAKKDKDKLMGIIEHDINRLDRLITDISRASRLDTELSRQSLKEVDLQRLLQEVLKVYAGPLEREERKQNGWNYEADHKGIHIRMRSGLSGPIYVRGLEGHLMQVFENILSNALSFAPQGSFVSLHVSTLKKRAVIKVENEGPSIPDGKEEAIFERFYSERPEHEDYGQNSGLGLSICRQIMDVHGGEIYAENICDTDQNPKGVRFTVMLNKA